MKQTKLLETIKQLKNGYHIDKETVKETIKELEILEGILKLRLKIDF